MSFKPDPARSMHPQERPPALKPRGAAPNICKKNGNQFEHPQAACKAFFHENGSINYAEAFKAAEIARSSAFRTALQAAWRGLKRATFQVLGAFRQ